MIGRRMLGGAIGLLRCAGYFRGVVWGLLVWFVQGEGCCKTTVMESAVVCYRHEAVVRSAIWSCCTGALWRWIDSINLTGSCWDKVSENDSYLECHAVNSESEVCRRDTDAVYHRPYNMQRQCEKIESAFPYVTTSSRSYGSIQESFIYEWPKRALVNMQRCIAPNQSPNPLRSYWGRRLDGPLARITWRPKIYPRGNLSSSEDATSVSLGRVG